MRRAGPFLGFTAREGYPDVKNAWNWLVAIEKTYRGGRGRERNKSVAKFSFWLKPSANQTVIQVSNFACTATPRIDFVAQLKKKRHSFFYNSFPILTGWKSNHQQQESSKWRMKKKEESCEWFMSAAEKLSTVYEDCKSDLKKKKKKVRVGEPVTLTRLERIRVSLYKSHFWVAGFICSIPCFFLFLFSIFFLLALNCHPTETTSSCPLNQMSLYIEGSRQKSTKQSVTPPPPPPPRKK